MPSDSRKAQHNSFAHHRAKLLFSPLLPASSGAPRLAAIGRDTEPHDGRGLRQRVRDGLLGYGAAAPAAGLTA